MLVLVLLLLIQILFLHQFAVVAMSRRRLVPSSFSSRDEKLG
jgi:hypothetical protein